MQEKADGPLTRRVSQGKLRIVGIEVRERAIAGGFESRDDVRVDGLGCHGCAGPLSDEFNKGRQRFLSRSTGAPILRRPQVGVLHVDFRNFLLKCRPYLLG